MKDTPMQITVTDDPDHFSEFESWFIDTFDFEAWLTLCKAFGGQRVYVPSSPSVEQRNRQIKKEYDEILSTDKSIKQEPVYSFLASKHDLSVSQIRRVLF